MRLLSGVLVLLVLAATPLASAQDPVATSLAVSGAGSVQDLTETPTKTVVMQVQFTARQTFTCTADTPITVEVTVATKGPITASVDNKTLTYTIPAAHSPVQPYREDATTTLTVTRTGAHQEAEAVVTATYAGGTNSACVPSTFAAANASVPVRTTALTGGPGNGGGNATAPTIAIASPRAGAQGAQFDMVVSVNGFDLKPVPTSPGVVAGQGHIHYLVDGKPAEGDYATAAKNFTFKGLLPGERTLRAELVNNDHTPLSPPVFAEVKVQATVPTPGGTTPATSTPATSTPATTTPATDDGEGEEKGLPAPGIVGVALAAVAAALVLRRRQ